MDPIRKRKLKRNNKLLFWGRSFSNIKILNAVLSLFYVANGLTPSQIVWVSLFWAGTVLLFEIPSSYMADRWGRKKTLMFGTFFGFLQWVVLFQADSFAWVALAMVCYGIWSASFSGTDIALLYDTKKELEEEHDSLRDIGHYASAMNLFKMFSVIAGVFIAKDLTQDQFSILISIDIVATCLSLIIFSQLIEPNHYMDVEEQEAGIFKDAFTLIKKQPLMQRGIINRVLLFLMSYAIWTYYHVFYTSMGISVIMLGVGWSFFHAIVFLIKRNAHVFASKFGLARTINSTTWMYGVVLSVLIIAYFMGAPGFVLFPLWLLSSLVMGIRWPLFDEYFNSFSASYNRATVLSLTNFLHNILEFPILLTAGFLVAHDPIYPYIFAVIIVILVITTSSVKEKPVRLID